ncbi:MAG: NINE protein [Comamonadaceae bacterium]|nr:MAG: NINE protein [Comamonadaceae bacterium]
MTSAHAIPSTPAFRSKATAALLALLLGVVGAHWWYLRRRGAWAVAAVTAISLLLAARAPVWYDTPAFFVVFIPLLAGIIEAAVLALMRDAAFDSRYNPGLPPATRTGLPHVLIAIGCVLAGGVIGMFAIAMVVMHVYERMGWLDGMVY